MTNVTILLPHWRCIKSRADAPTRCLTDIGQYYDFGDGVPVKVTYQRWVENTSFNSLTIVLTFPTEESATWFILTHGISQIA